MKSTRSSLLISQKNVGLNSSKEKTASDIPLSRIANSHEKLLPALIVCIYYLNIWSPPILPSVLGFLNHWYVALGLAVFALLIQKTYINMKATQFYWVYFGLLFMGAVISLLRAPFLTIALRNSVAQALSFITILLFIPVLGTKLTRKFLLITLIVTSILWTFEIQSLVNTYETLIYSTFAITGENKNDIGYGLALAAIAFLYFAVFWQPRGNLPPWRVFFTRVIFGLGGLYFFYFQTLIYARGSMVATMSGIVAILVIVFIRSREKASGIAQVGLITFFIMLAVVVLYPKILTISPQYEIMFYRSTSEGILSIFNNRDVLFQKGIYLIAQNPILGVGLGGSRYVVASDGTNFPSYLIHNTFLTDWVEMGVLGLLANIIWVGAYVRLLRTKFSNLPIVDQIWLLLFIPIITQMFFKNIGAAPMIAIMAGIYYEQYILDQTLRISDFRRIGIS